MVNTHNTTMPIMNSGYVNFEKSMSLFFLLMFFFNVDYDNNS